MCKPLNKYIGELKDKKLGYGLALNIIPAILITIAVWLLSYSTPLIMKASMWYTIPIVAYLLNLAIAWFIQYSVAILKKKAKYDKGLLATVAPQIYAYCWLILVAILRLFSKNSIYLGIVTTIFLTLGVIALILGTIKSIETLLGTTFLEAVVIVVTISSIISLPLGITAMTSLMSNVTGGLMGGLLTQFSTI